jgi:L-ascorbate metabolism protein UlaG (beta-lactamase superfamily)
MNLGGVIELPFGYVRMTLAFHSSSLPDGSYGGSPSGFYLTLDDGNVYFACDTALFNDMRIIGAFGVDLAVLPIGDRFTMGPQDSIQAINLIGPGRVTPCHYNTWPIIHQSPQGWEALVRENTTAEPIVLEPGGKITL